MYDLNYKKYMPISIIGLGYVGLPLAVAFAKKGEVIGFDINESRIEQYKAGVDQTDEVGNVELKKSTVRFTSNPEDLQQSRFHIVAVPTPVKDDNTPDLSAVTSACETLGRYLTPGSIVVFESTVYPGVTEDICVPILEEKSSLKCGIDFKVGYSPERINPGDKEHRLDNIVKIVSGMDAETLEIAAKVYELVVEAGVYKAPNIKVAEAAKAIENAQRDINIAFMNELSLIFHRLGIDTQEVLKAAGTKWNFLNFKPGLVGGHCIGVDPYYLTYRAEQAGYHPQIIIAGRRINDDMGKYIAANTVQQLVRAKVNVCKSNILILGFTFKENCPDIRNTRVIDIVDELKEYGVVPQVYDPIANSHEMQEHYSIKMRKPEEINQADCLIVAVAHDEFADLELSKYLKPGGVLIDVKGLFETEKVKAERYIYWRL